jgi:predicted acyl esterase
VVPVELALLPHATRFRAGDELRLELRGRWLFPRNPLTGQFPAGYQRPPAATCTVLTGGAHDSHLRFGTRAVARD